jgi:hypothetical protein
MNVHTQINDYLAAQPERKRADMQALHSMMLRLMPTVDCGSWTAGMRAAERSRTSGPLPVPRGQSFTLLRLRLPPPSPE